jgi:hypothetical protein
MVFDGYKQFSIGQSSNVQKRSKQHWTSRKPFDRVVYGTVYDSIFPVDELRALDTTRIYAAKSVNPFAAEERAERAADQRFCLNRMGGGDSPVTLMLSALNPRRRPTDDVAQPATKEDYERTWDDVENLVSQPREANSSLAHELAALDMAIHSVEREHERRSCGPGGTSSLRQQSAAI